MIELIIDQRRLDLGGGFEVGRVLPFAKRRMVGPFIFFDHMGPLEVEPGAVAEVPSNHKERALYIAAGAIEMHGQRYDAGQMLVLSAGSSHFKAKKPSTVMVLGGEAIGERFLFWNFVSSSTDRLAQAASDWKAGRMKLPDADNAEFIPLPEEPVPPAPTAS